MADTPLSFVTICGSLRKGSLNRRLMHTLPDFAPAGVSFTPFEEIGAMPHYNADLQGAEGFPEAATRLRDLIADSDGVIIVSPEYNYSMPGVLKNAIDWISRFENQPFKHKPLSLMSASPSPFGGARCQVALRQSFVFLDARVFSMPEVMVYGAHDKISEDGQLTDERTRGIVTQHLEGFAAFARQLQG